MWRICGPPSTGWQIHLHEKAARNQGTRDALPSRVIGNAARLCRRGRHRDDRKGWLLRTSPGHNAMVLTEQRTSLSS
jgi:hypothetical protein